MWRQVYPTRIQRLSEALISAICDGGIHDQHQAGFETSPKAGPAVFTVNDLAAGFYNTFLLTLSLSLLSGCDDGNGYGKELRQGASHSS